MNRSASVALSRCGQEREPRNGDARSWFRRSRTSWWADPSVAYEAPQRSTAVAASTRVQSTIWLTGVQRSAEVSSCSPAGP